MASPVFYVVTPVCHHVGHHVEKGSEALLIDSIRSLFAGHGIDFSAVLAQVISVLVIIFLILPFHELAHGFVANKLGDPTAKYNGRLTFNPLASVDIMGALFLLLFGFGWAKPVPVNPNNFKNPRRDMALTALAGPVANIIAALAGSLVFWILYAAVGFTGIVMGFLRVFLMYYVMVNMSLAVFNLLPIPPLDGSRILSAFLPRRLLEPYYKHQNTIIMIFFMLLFLGVFSRPLGALQSALTNFAFSSIGRLFDLLGLL